MSHLSGGWQASRTRALSLVRVLVGPGRDVTGNCDRCTLVTEEVLRRIVCNVALAMIVRESEASTVCSRIICRKKDWV